MTKRIIIHATNTPADQPITLDDIIEMNSEDRRSDPMPYHYIVGIDGRILKGKRDRELCGHCGKFWLYNVLSGLLCFQRHCKHNK